MKKPPKSRLTPEEVQAIADRMGQAIVRRGSTGPEVDRENLDYASASGTFRPALEYSELVVAIEARDREAIRRILVAAGGLTPAEIEALILEKIGPDEGP